MKSYGKKTWLIPDLYLDSVSCGNQKSHEAVCVINTCNEDADIKFTLFFEDRDCDESFSAVCPAKRTHHIRMDRIKNPEGRMIPVDTPYALLLESSVPVVVQYSRLDSSQSELALMTTIAYPVEE